MHLLSGDADTQGPGRFNLSGQTSDGTKPAFAALREPHLRPKQTMGTERRFRLEERRGMIKSGIHDLVLPGPGEYIRPLEEPKRTIKTMMTQNRLHPMEEAAACRTSFGGTAVGISVDPTDRCDTPRGRGQWVRGKIMEASASGAPEVCTQEFQETQGVVSDMYANLNYGSSFLHGSFNVKAQKGARTPIRSKVMASVGKGLDSRGRVKMNRYAAQPVSITRNANAMA